MAGEQLFWEDVQAGTEITPLKKTATTQQLVMYAGASQDLYQVHYDKDFALGNNLPGVIIHGALKNAWLGQLMTDWIGEHGTLVKLGVQYRGMDVPNDPLTCKGVVTNKYEKSGKHYVECDIWLENSRGERTTPGSATAVLPSRVRPWG